METMTESHKTRTGNIFTLAASRHDRECKLCGAVVSKNALSLSSHGKKHVREGTAQQKSVWAYGNVYRTIYVAVEVAQ